ncbi:hypothetical protein L1887_28738 [Cichorium endivia]|nr:hypothetical protein L1887_28738 [Cichorium endivia]
MGTDKIGNFLFGMLQNSFGFQEGNVANQRDKIVVFLAFVGEQNVCNFIAKVKLIEIYVIDTSAHYYY